MHEESEMYMRNKINGMENKYKKTSLSKMKKTSHCLGNVFDKLMSSWKPK